MELNLTSCGLQYNGDISFKVQITPKAKNDVPLSTTFRERVEASKIWKAVDICRKEACLLKAWSPSRMDVKSALGVLDAGSGQLYIDEGAANLIDIPL